MKRDIHNYSQFLLEKRIDQISSKIEITFAFDIIKTKHAGERQDFSARGLDVDNQKFISNSELKEFVRYFKNEISESIGNEEIVDGSNFVIRSKDRELAMAMAANHQQGSYWKLVIITVFRVSEEHPFHVRKGDVLFDK